VSSETSIGRSSTNDHGPEAAGEPEAVSLAEGDEHAANVSTASVVIATRAARVPDRPPSRADLPRSIEPHLPWDS
jgi:hypothetical protein